jgi:hypothetical protein
MILEAVVTATNAFFALVGGWTVGGWIALYLRRRFP